MMAASSMGLVCRIGLLGFGTVGASVAKALGALGAGGPTGLELRYVYNRGVARKQASAEAAFVGENVLWTEDVEAVLGADDVDVVVELVGGVEPAKEWIERALRAGKHVVTAN